MEANQEWNIGTESNLDVEFLVPDSLGNEADSVLHKKEFSVLHGHLQPVSPILFDCIEEDTAPVMASGKRLEKNPFAVDSELETDHAEALVADTASDHSGSSVKDESMKNVTVIRVSPGGTLREPTSTPAQSLSCLQLSGNPMLVPETMDSLDAVPPSLDAFDPQPVPTIVPDSPSDDHDRASPLQKTLGAEDGSEDDEDDDGVVSFKPMMPTVNTQEENAMQATTQHSLGVIESQNFHLRFSQSQATSEPDDKNKENDDDFGLIPRPVEASDQLNQAPASTSWSEDQGPSVQTAIVRKPSFNLQKPTVGLEDGDPPEEGTQGSISVFKRIKSGVASPIKLKRVADDSEEILSPKSKAKRDKLHHQVFDLEDPGSTKAGQSMLMPEDEMGAAEKLTSTELSFPKKGAGGTGRKKTRFFSDDSNTLLHEQCCETKAASPNSCTEGRRRSGEEQQSEILVVSEDIDAHSEDQEETLPYSYTEPKGHKSEATTSEMVMDKHSDSGSDNFILSQKRMVPKSSKGVSDSQKEFQGFESPHQEDASMDVVEDLVKQKSLQEALDLQNSQQTLLSPDTQNKEGTIGPSTSKSADVLSCNTAIEAGKADKGPAKKIMPSCPPVETGDLTVAEDGRELTAAAASTTTIKHQIFSEGSALVQSTSLDPYAFRDSQSQGYAAGPSMPLSDKPYVSARGKRAAVVKTMRKVLRKKNPQQQGGNKSSSSDVPEISKRRPGRRKKGGQQGRQTSPVIEENAQPAEETIRQGEETSVTAREEHESFTSLQDRNQFSRPQDLPPVKHGAKHAAEPKGSSSHTETGDGQRPAKKTSTVSFSTNNQTSSTAREVAGSPEHETERTTVQQVTTTEIIVTTKVIRETFNSKGQCLRRSETTELVQKIKYDPIVAKQEVMEKVVPVDFVLSPSRSTSTVTTGDLADISSSSLSRTFSSGSKTSMEVLPSSQSLPTPAQRQRSLDKADTVPSLPHADSVTSETAALTTVPSVTALGAPPTLSKSDSKRSSAGSNTGQDLFSTPNQSIINPADSQLGKIFSCSANSTPDEQGAQGIVTSPSHTSAVHVMSGATHRDGTQTSPLHPNSASASQHHSPTKNPADVPSCGTSHVMISQSPKKAYPSPGGSSTEGIRKISVPQTAALGTSAKRGKNAVNQARNHSRREEVGESTDIQSTGFSVHGAPALTASGDSGKGPASVVASSKQSTCDSTEISLQGAVQKDQNTPFILTDYKSKPTVGAKVMGKWRDGFYYPGTLSKVDPGKRAMVCFDDGSQRWVRPHEIILAADLPVGQSVMVLGEGKDDFYLPGMVMGHSETETRDLLYQVERDDGVRQRCKRSSLILSEDQAACLLSDEELMFSADAMTPSTSKPSDISLDNLVEGKRHPRSAHQATASTSKTAAAPPSSPTREPASVATDTTGASASASKSGRKRKMGPVATSTPTPKQARQQGKGTPVKRNTTSNLGSVMSSPAESRKSPRKAKMAGLFRANSPSNPSLFEGMVFMLTHAEKSAKWRAYEKQLLQYSSLDTSVDENTDIEPDVPPYNKEQLHALIESSGGRIVASLDPETIAQGGQCFLVAAEHQRTVKYMQALAAGVKIISHQWVLVSVQENKLQGLVAYTLPAGISYEKRKLVEGSKGCPELSKQVIMVVSNDDDFVKAWTSILSLTQCHLATRFPARATKSDPGIDVVVSDATCPASLVRRCGQLNVPLVSSEWVAQCLINGRVIDAKGHQKYKHDFMENETAPHNIP